MIYNNCRDIYDRHPLCIKSLSDASFPHRTSFLYGGEGRDANIFLMFVNLEDHF